MKTAWLSWAVCGISLWALWLTGSKKRLGFLIGALNQVLWFTLGILVPQNRGFIPMAVIFAAVYLRGWIRWKSKTVVDPAGHLIPYNLGDANWPEGNSKF